MHSIERTLLLVTLTSSLVACGSGGNSGAASAGSSESEPDMVRYVGLIDMATTSTTLVDTASGGARRGENVIQNSVSANFLYADEPFDANALGESLQTLLVDPVASCRDTDAPRPAPEPAGPGPVDAVETAGSFGSADAGARLSLTTPAGGRLELVRTDPSDPDAGDDYVLENGLQAELLLAGTMLDIPGGERSLPERPTFPAFAAVALPEQQPLLDIDISGDVDGNPGPDSIISWRAGSDPDRLLSLRLRQFKGLVDGRGDFDGIECSTPDDGEFTIPQELKYVFTVDDRPSFSVFLFRDATSVVQRGDAALIISNTAQAELDNR